MPSGSQSNTSDSQDGSGSQSQSQSQDDPSATLDLDQDTRSFLCGGCYYSLWEMTRYFSSDRVEIEGFYYCIACDRFGEGGFLLRQGSRRMVLEDRDLTRHHMFRMFSDSIARLMREIQRDTPRTQTYNANPQP
ncbi:hypothetical protein N7528_003333 [Penicillium herquei]|nr:hypothetical protein N7528_003333 [Penicillium herquei]